MNTKRVSRRKGLISVGTVVSLFSVFLVAPALGADTLVTPINLVQPAGIPNVAPLPFLGTTAITFSVPSTLATLTVTPNQGTVGSPMVISGKGLPANAALTMTWGTSSGTWVADVEPSTVNYLGTSFTKINVNMPTVTTDATGAFSYATTVPSDFGGVHDIYVIQNGVALGHGGYQI